MSEELTVTVAEYRRRAAHSLPAALFDRSFGDSENGLGATDRNNMRGFELYALRARVLTSAPNPDLSTTVLDQRISMPVMLSAVGGQSRYSLHAESGSARAAGEMGTLMCVSVGSSQTLEHIAGEAIGPLWFQVNIFRDRGLTQSLVKRAEAAGYKAIVVTVDAPGTRSTERDHPASLHLRELRIANSIGMYESPYPNVAEAGIDTTEKIIEAFDVDIGWDDIGWLASLTSLPIVVKGIQAAEDAALCPGHGAAGLIVSNHGGHALADARSTVEVLEEVVEAVHGEIEVYLDGGIRKGTDIMKALGLGARAVGVGRAFIWGLAAGGEGGVREVLEILREDLLLTAHHCGVGDVKTVKRGLVTRSPATRPVTDAVVGVEALERMASLLERGLLSREEFDDAKARLLGLGPSSPTGQ